jgi:pyruvate kinase
MIDRICTIGPASNRREVLSELIDHGMTMIRLNLSHGNHESHNDVIQLVRSISKEKDKEIKILGDLQGPKIRLGQFHEKSITLQEGETFLLTTDEVVGNNKVGSIDYKGLVHDVEIGSKILINDGEVKLTVTGIDPQSIKTIVNVGGTISSRKGVNVPGTALSLPALTEKDKQDIQFLIDQQVDFIACSFIRTPNHIEHIREFLIKRTTNPPKLMAKIETLEAIQNFVEICKKSDAIMIARGDLGVELPFQWIPLLQKAIIYECNKAEKFVVTATQMLQSMTEHAVPTRAEVTDIFQAVLDGTNAVMLSAESASGSHPIESIETLRTISQFSEIAKKYDPFDFTDMIKLINNEIL